jgi:hypothetical protein
MLNLSGYCEPVISVNLTKPCVRRYPAGVKCVARGYDVYEFLAMHLTTNYVDFQFKKGNVDFFVTLPRDVIGIAHYKNCEEYVCILACKLR